MVIDFSKFLKFSKIYIYAHIYIWSLTPVRGRGVHQPPLVFKRSKTRGGVSLESAKSPKIFSPAALFLLTLPYISDYMSLY